MADGVFGIFHRQAVRGEGRIEDIADVQPFMKDAITEQTGELADILKNDLGVGKVESTKAKVEVRSENAERRTPNIERRTWRRLKDSFAALPSRSPQPRGSTVHLVIPDSSIVT
jgi:hypothetical protein